MMKNLRAERNSRSAKITGPYDEVFRLLEYAQEGASAKCKEYAARLREVEDECAAFERRGVRNVRYSLAREEREVLGRMVHDSAADSAAICLLYTKRAE